MPHTKGPWSWTHIGEKTNGYVVGVSCNVSGEQLSGYIDDRDDMVDEIIYKLCIGEHEASTVNYDDAKLICAAPDLLAALQKALNESGCDGDLCCHEWHDAARAAISKAVW